MDASIFMTLFVSMFLSEKERKAEEDKARERRMAEHRMNARLLRFNI